MTVSDIFAAIGLGKKKRQPSDKSGRKKTRQGGSKNSKTKPGRKPRRGQGKK